MQNPDYNSEEFEILTVGDAYVQMAELVKSNSKDHTFENGRAFYQFTSEDEDFDSFKEVVLMEMVSAIAHIRLAT